ncbi:hypothetical protein [Corynebacterium matruchotii]|uniref:hypothetical protein n=1 Tax=Corynebacterium matruchotii TaxID=43768 RepID=UPI001FC9DB0A|nr:hypothetical protein [Corynebacterium matruchotii]
MVVEADALFGGAGFGDEVEVVGAEGVQSLMGVNIGVGVRWVPAPLAAILVQPERENVASWSPCPILPASPRMVASSGVKDFLGVRSRRRGVARLCCRRILHFEGDAGADEAA